MTDIATSLVRVEWADLQSYPVREANPRFPDGMDVDCSYGSSITCVTRLTYPAIRCGVYTITCLICGIQISLNTTGLADDPQLLMVACQVQSRA